MANKLNDDPSEGDFDIGLTPMTRVSMTLEREAEIEPALLSDLAPLDRYVEIYREWERRRDSTFKSLIVFDAAVAFLIAGNNLTVPLFDIQTSSIPIILEIATAIASISFIFVNTSLLNVTIYDLLISSSINKMSKTGLIDTDFVKASRITFDFTAKVFQRRFSASGSDPYVPYRAFRITSVLIEVLTSLAFIALLFVHFYIITKACLITIQSAQSGLPLFAYLAFVGILNLLGLLLAVVPWLSFSFKYRADTLEVFGKRDLGFYWRVKKQREADTDHQPGGDPTTPE